MSPVSRLSLPNGSLFYQLYLQQFCHVSTYVCTYITWIIQYILCTEVFKVEHDQSINCLIFIVLVCLFFYKLVATLPVTALIIDWESTYHSRSVFQFYDTLRLCILTVHLMEDGHFGEFQAVYSIFLYFFPPPQNNKTLLDVDFSIFRHVEMLHSMTPSHAKEKKKCLHFKPWNGTWKKKTVSATWDHFALMLVFPKPLSAVATVFMYSGILSALWAGVQQSWGTFFQEKESVNNQDRGKTFFFVCFFKCLKKKNN